MDFAALMSKEISKGKPSSQETPDSEPTKKYLKRADLEAQRQEAYLQEQKTIHREREEKLSQKRKLEEEEAARTRERDEKRRRLASGSHKRREEEDQKAERARRRRLGLPDLPPKPQASAEDPPPPASADADIPDDVLISHLRALHEPATLFGETHRQRLRRYRQLTAAPATPAATPGPIPTTLALVPESDMKVPATLPTDAVGRAFLFRQLASYFSMVLAEWAAALGQRPQSVRESFQGRAAEEAMRQSRENMRPLFRRFERGEVEEGILGPVVGIVRAAQERRYVDANDGYLTLSIGKAAWPIGVTMVGIHERSAREKLHESDKGQAHIMSDEVTRKFLQSIKRCLSFAQTRWPPDDQLQLMG
ncbi:MAG: potassium channel regulatory factor [Lasallia pustulata]|uniref:Pre-mRNA-splicing factor 18 n=1 Tax=Lasallia pustulata TaxID=136370 RepID=A0A5M8PTY5_9LECA|nr:MAG: potassium channel regulatory factor [Lasallia pustulata]